MKACREKRGTAPLTLNLDVRWKWAVNSQIEVSGQQLDGSERSTVRWKWAVNSQMEVSGQDQTPAALPL